MINMATPPPPKCHCLPAMRPLPLSQSENLLFIYMYAYETRRYMKSVMTVAMQGL